MEWSKKILFILILISLLAIGCTSQGDGDITVVAEKATPVPTRPVSTATAVPTTLPTVTATIIAEPTATVDSSAPVVINHTPNESPSTERRPEFQIEFSQEMVFGVMVDAIQVEPEIAFSLQQEGNLLTVTIDEALLPGETYKFSISEAAVAQNGQTLERPFTWDYQLEPMIANAKLPTRGDLQQPIEITFNYAINPDLENIRLMPEVAGQPQWLEGNTVLTFTPDEPLLSGTRYAVHFDGGWFELGGEGAPLVEPEIIVFETSSAIMQQFPNAGDHVHPSTIVSLSFAVPMDKEATKDAFTISPHVPGVLEWHDDLLELHPITDRLLPNTLYTVTLLETAVNADGQPILSEPHSWTFETTDMHDLASFGRGEMVQTMTLNGRRTVEFDVSGDKDRVLNFNLYQLSLNDWLTGNTSGGEKVSSWQETIEEKSEQYYQVNETTLPEIAAGIYRLEMGLDSYVEDQLLIFMTDHLLSVANDNETISAWVVDENGRSVSDTMVRVYDGTTEVANGRTTASGFVQIPVKVNHGFKIVAETGAKPTVIGLDDDWNLRNGPTSRDNILLHTTTDRPVYRGGETLHFRTILRQDNDGIAEIVPVGTAVEMELLFYKKDEYQWEHVTTTTVESNHFGTANGALTLPEKVGEYRLKAIVGERTHSVQIDVAQDVHEPFSVAISTDRPIYAQGEEIPVEIIVRDLDGNPLPEMSVTLSQYESGNTAHWGSTGQNDQWMYSYHDSITRRTDENGRIDLNIAAEIGYYFHRVPNTDNAEHSITALHAIAKENGRTANAYTVIELSNTAEYVMMELDNRIQAPNQPFAVRGMVQEMEGMPVNGRNVQLDVYAYNAETNDYDNRQQSLTLTSDANGNVTTELSLTQIGKYRLRLTVHDAFGNKTSSSELVAIYDPTNQTIPAGTKLNVFKGQQTYTIGETAQLLIESSESGPAWLTVSRGGMMHQEVVELTAPMTLVELPLLDAYAPNVSVSVNMWEEVIPTIQEDYYYQSTPDQNLRSATVNLTVIDPHTELQVVFAADKEAYAPGEDAEFTVRILNHQGEPVSAEVAFSMVDEAIFANYSPHAKPLSQAFHFKRVNALSTYHSMAAVRFLGDYFGGCGCGGGEMYPDDEMSSHFHPFNLWNPSLVTDHNGEATFTITMPEVVGDWHISLQAVSADTQLGDTAVTVSTK